MARLLVLRGIVDEGAARAFLKPELIATALAISDDWDEGCGRTAGGGDRERKERILIYGDYDVDGTTAVVILKTVIELCGGQADFHVPHRIIEGYGMRDEVIERAAADGVQLIISVDTGIRAFAAAETAERLGLDLIVTDHHLPHDQGVPKALAVLNPNQAGCEYPCKSLCGAGVAFKVAQALLERTGRERLIPSFLKVVAIATIADAVPLIGENRIFVKLGLAGLSHPVNAGLKALLEICDLTHGRGLTASEVAFRIAPRMNAAGRMDVAKDVIELFTVKDPVRAREIAAHLNQLNGDRQQEEGRIVDAIHKANCGVRGVARRVLHGGGWRRLAPRSDRYLRVASGRQVLSSGAGDLARWRRGAWLGTVDLGIPSAERAGIVRGIIHALRRTRTRSGIRAADEEPAGIETATGCVRARATNAGGLCSGAGI